MAKDNVTDKIVNEELADIDAKIARIDAQLTGLQDARDALVLVRKALSPLIRSGNGVPMKRKGKTGAKTNGQQAVMPAISAAVTAIVNGTSASHATGTGFSQAIRAVFKNKPRGLKPKEVLKALAATGELALYTGKLDPATRIGNELYFLRKKGVLARRAGRYSLTKTDLPVQVTP